MVKILVLLVLVLGLSGCLTSDPLLASADAFVNKTVGPEYEAYLGTGMSPEGVPFTEDQIARRMENVRFFRLAVKEAQGG